MAWRNVRQSSDCLSGKNYKDWYRDILLRLNSVKGKEKINFFSMDLCQLTKIIEH